MMVYDSKNRFSLCPNSTTICITYTNLYYRLSKILFRMTCDLHYGRYTYKKTNVVIILYSAHRKAFVVRHYNMSTSYYYQ